MPVKSKIEVMKEKCPTFAMQYGFLQNSIVASPASKLDFTEIETMFETVFETYLKERKN